MAAKISRFDSIRIFFGMFYKIQYRSITEFRQRTVGNASHQIFQMGNLPVAWKVPNFYHCIECALPYISFKTFPVIKSNSAIFLELIFDVWMDLGASLSNGCHKTFHFWSHFTKTLFWFSDKWYWKVCNFLCSLRISIGSFCLWLSVVLDIVA